MKIYNIFVFHCYCLVDGWFQAGEGGGGTAIYGLYRYVPMRRVWFSSSLRWDRAYKSESLGLKEGIIFHLKLINWLKILVQTRETGNCHSKKSNRFCFSWTVLATSVVKGSRVPAAHPHSKSPKVPPGVLGPWKPPI